ncbi:hypothetical protein GA0074695_1189 [Micromonospora viridifaciens]|uniref:Lipoprotein n=1 Tax=Micromonospora viridifaciens TaxID=1881 RepID=A0A1C4V6Q2_MICVI|nr:hypothetical protein [Micromonospora viridifaciens]SCE79624.1 hypothetical protein GA0074695_1189 [Micromonospora viridifaciens]
MRKTTTALALGVAGAIVFGLAGCTPADRPLIAVRAADGEPAVLLAGCSDFQIDSISLLTTSRDVTALVDGPDRELRRTGTQVPESMPLFGPPPTGWEVTDDRLTALTADQPYGLAAYSNGRPTVPITFTAADLAELGPDEVLVGKTLSSHEKVTEREYRKRAKNAC